MPWLSRYPGTAVLLAAAAVFVGPISGEVQAALVINELLPDPEGSDGGREFVEFLNTGPEPIVLESVEFQFANGAEGPVWRVRWTGPAGAVLPPGERFLLVDRNWTGNPPGDAEASLGLQNGPDAVRLVRGDTILDLVGYGPLTDPALSEGDPVAVVTGLALARRPDGGDTDDNAFDFVPAAPTAGTINFRPWSLAVETVALEPPSLVRPGDRVSVHAVLRNDGLEAWPPTSARASVGGDAADVNLARWPAGETRAVTWLLRPSDAGSQLLEITAHPAGAPQRLVLAAARLQVGPGVLVINEVLAAPTQDQGEWFELLAAGPAAVDLGDFEVCDEGGSWRSLPAVPLAPGQLAVVAQDSAALAAWIGAVSARGGRPSCADGPEGAPLLSLSDWPTLNNTTDAETGFADRLRLRDRGGGTIDHVVVGASGGPDVPGRSLERSGPRPTHPTGPPWAVCTAAPGSTPGCTNSIVLAASGPGAALDIVPQVLDAAAGAGAVHALFVVPESARGWRLRVYDLWGVLVRDFGGDQLGPGPRDLLWDGRDDAGGAVPAGGYVFVLELTTAAGTGRGERQLCAVWR